jgi:hypothetical protein
MASNPIPIGHKEIIWRHYKWTCSPSSVKKLKDQNVIEFNGAFIFELIDTKKKIPCQLKHMQYNLCPQLSHDGFALKKCQNQ